MSIKRVLTSPIADIFKSQEELLYKALRNGDLDTVRKYIKDGFNLDFQLKNFHLTPLIYSCMEYPSFAEELIEAGANITFKTSQYGNTALLSSVRYGRDRLIKILLAKGADINVQNNDEETALIRAIIYNKTSIALELIDLGADLKLKTEYGNDALLIAIRKGSTKIVKKLLKNGADINTQNNDDETPLIRAIYNDETSIALELIEQGAFINIKDINGNTALLLAAGKGNTRVVKKLLEKGADINVQNNDGETPLIRAAEKQSVETILLLLENDADVNILSNTDRNALMRAVYRENVEIAQALIDAGSKLDVVNKDGNTALKIAKDHDQDDIVKMIKIANGEYIETKRTTKRKSRSSVREDSEIVEKWQEMGNDRISFTGIYPEQELKLVEIYNFSSRERMSISEDIQTGLKNLTLITSFNDVAQPAIEKALENFQAKGGVADRSFVLNNTTILKKPTL